MVGRISPAKVGIIALAMAAFVAACSSSAYGPLLSGPGPNPAGTPLPIPSITPSSVPSPTPTSASGKVALMDLGTGTYLGFQGGLYPNSSDTPPPAHASVGSARAAAIQRLDESGSPSASGKAVLLSIGMSNTNDEWCGVANNAGPCNSWTFMGKAATDPSLNHSWLVIANGAMGGMAAQSWVSPTTCISPPPDGYCNNYDRVAGAVLTPLGVTEKQVQTIWLKQADPGPTVSLPSSSADAYTLEKDLGQIVRAAKVRYPNLQIVFLSSRTYGGYATTGLNPEPYAYESGFAVKWLVAAQINQMATGSIDPVAGDLNYNNGSAPWLAWSAYLWANGTTPRSDGLVWCNGQSGSPCSSEVDFQSDGTHPSQSGQTKVANLLITFFKTSQFTTPWFL